MTAKVEHVLQEAASTDQAMQNHDVIITARGDGAKKRDKLKSQIDSLTRLNNSQIKASNFMESKTVEQNDLMNESSELFTQIQNAAKSASKEKGSGINLKVFRIGTDKPSSAKGMATLLSYLSDVVVEYNDMLLANGMTADELARVPELYAMLVGVDAAQENAKKIRNAATARRDEAALELQATITGIRNYAKTIFKNDKAALEEFKPLPKGRRAGKPPAGTAGQQPAS